MVFAVQTDGLENASKEYTPRAVKKLLQRVQKEKNWLVIYLGANQDAINVVMNRYWGPDHRPASTTVEIVRLATDPRFILEVEAVAVLPD